DPGTGAGGAFRRSRRMDPAGGRPVHRSARRRGGGRESGRLDEIRRQRARLPRHATVPPVVAGSAEPCLRAAVRRLLACEAGLTRRWWSVAIHEGDKNMKGLFTASAALAATLFLAGPVRAQQ